MSPGTCADLTVFSGTKRLSRSNSPHYPSLAHTHPAALPSLPCLPTCLFSQADTNSRSSRQAVQQGNTQRLDSKQSPQQPKNPRTGSEMQTRILAPSHILLWASCLDAVERSSSHDSEVIQLLPATSASVLEPEVSAAS